MRIRAYLKLCNSRFISHASPEFHPNLPATLPKLETSIGLSAFICEVPRHLRKFISSYCRPLPQHSAMLPMIHLLFPHRLLQFERFRHPLTLDWRQATSRDGSEDRPDPPRLSLHFSVIWCLVPGVASPGSTSSSHWFYFASPRPNRTVSSPEIWLLLDMSSISGNSFLLWPDPLQVSYGTHYFAQPNTLGFLLELESKSGEFKSIRLHVHHRRPISNNHWHHTSLFWRDPRLVTRRASPWTDDLCPLNLPDIPRPYIRVAIA